MNFLRNITIIGTGQVGSILAYRFLKKGYNITLIEAGDLAHRHNRQVPWGWWRTKTLQPKPRLHRPPVDIPFKPNQRYGPMLLTTSDDNKVNIWKDWISRNQTDAHILTPKESLEKYDIPVGCFNPKKIDQGGTLVCDSNDFIIDFDQLNKELYKLLKGHPKCQIIENFPVSNVTNDSGDIVITSDRKKESIRVQKVILACGNQNYRIVNNYPPVILMRLPYVRAKITGRGPNYISLWNPNSSLTIFDQDHVKIGCGNLHGFEKLAFKYIPYYIPMGIGAFLEKKTSYFKDLNQILEITLSDLKKFTNLNLEIDHNSINSCQVDLTPTLLPIVDFIKPNLLAIGGLSGSGFTVYEKWFGESVIEAIETNQLNDNLRPFRKRSMIDHWYPNQDDKPYIFR